MSIVHQDTDLPAVKNDLMLRAARGERVSRVPAWTMRQAGRYLPEFRALRAETDFFTMCHTPDLAATVTLQPLARVPELDAVVIFSDILIVPQAMGLECQMVPGKGPVFPEPLSSPEDVPRLNLAPPVSSYSWLFDAIRLTRQRMDGAVPVLGFCGGPWTLFAYMVEGGGSRTYAKARGWLYKHPESAHKVISAITDALVELLLAQWKAGASLLQVFESNAGELPPDLWQEFALPYLLKIAEQVRARTPAVAEGGPPLICFPRNARSGMEDMAASLYDVVGIDWATSPAEARAVLGGKKAVQGNLDPVALFASHEQIREKVHAMLEGFGVGKPDGCAVIGNLGHGMMPEHDPAAYEAFIKAVHSESEALLSASS